MIRSQPSDCGGCRKEERWFLHNIRHRGTVQLHCTSCVLKFNVGSFCPVCFQVYEDGLPKERVFCLKCPSATHLDCVQKANQDKDKDKDEDDSPPPPPSSPYVCPPCSNPDFVYFDLGNKRKKRESGEAVNEIKIDQKSANVLLAAAKVSLISMKKAVSAARIEADRRAKEAAVAKKRARESLEVVLCIRAKEKEKKKEMESGSGVSGLTLGGTEAEAVEREKKLKAKISAVAAKKRIQAQVKGEVGEKNCEGGNEGLKENENVVGSNVVNVMQSSPKTGASAVGERVKLEKFSVPVILTPSQSQNVQNGLCAVSSVKHLQHPAQGSHVMEADREKPKASEESVASPN